MQRYELSLVEIAGSLEIFGHRQTMKICAGERRRRLSGMDRRTYSRGKEAVDVVHTKDKIKDMELFLCISL